MVPRSTHFDLGRDRSHIKDPRDAERQHATVDVLLDRLFNLNLARRKEVQILADEVGMGKTFVALGVAYSVLAHIREFRVNLMPDLANCYNKILIITPQNSALFAKWERETSEFVRRCVVPEFQDAAYKGFATERIDRFDDLMARISRTGRGPSVLITHMGVLAGGKLRDYDLKRRFLLGVLFRYWGVRFRVERRERLLKGAPDGWPHNPSELTNLWDNEWDRLPFPDEGVPLSLLAELEKKDPRGIVEKLLEKCIEISEPYTRSRDEQFKQVESLLVRVYRQMVVGMVRKLFPLVIVDEAHNWKNGPSQGSNGFKEFAEIIAPNSRRALLLTATPFQLRPDEILEILKVSDHLSPCPQKDASRERRDELARLREAVIRPVLENSARASRQFAKAWASLPPDVKRHDIEQAWESPEVACARERLADIAHAEGVVKPEQMHEIADPILQRVDPTYRGLIREALHLYAYNADLSHELGAFVIRHRRRTDHRLFRIGQEFAQTTERVAVRQDKHVIHAAPGLDVRGEGELPHYLLMRCVTEMKKGKGKSSLGSALTGCYSTLIESAEGKSVRNILSTSGNGRVYLDLLMNMVNEKEDNKHPKLQSVVTEVLKAWQHGEKALIFCFRVNTARRLREIIDDNIRAELDAKRKNCLGSENGLRSLRSRLTGRDRDLSPLGMDRVLWSFLISRTESEVGTPPYSPSDIVLSDDDLNELARLALLFDQDLTGERVDRVFLHRATEYILAGQFLHNGNVSPWWHRFLAYVHSLNWIRIPYGWDAETEDEGAAEEETSYDERGLHTRYEECEEPKASAVKALAADLLERRNRQRRADRISVFDVYSQGPNLWLGEDPRTAELSDATAVKEIHTHLRKLTCTADGFDWQSRMMILQSLRRALLRESVLLRLLPEKEEREESGWGELLVQAFFAPLRNQQESMADRIAVFLEDIEASSGSVYKVGTQRHVLYESTRLRDQQFVALVFGDTKPEVKEKIFAGFNTPLLPEVLVCTSVGQEGIDLHRHCRHVIHYDLAWNPAVIEQRTGRTDRIGSKTFRERSLSRNGSPPHLEIGIPFLAGTYDERMYEELRLRAQTFEVLTGGDLARDNVEGSDEVLDAEGKGEDLSLASLPREMIDSLRVRLEVWRPTD